MVRALILFVGGLTMLGSCTQRAICPAFQSAYIYDKDELRKKFSYFQEDTTPKVLTASKNRYLVAEPTPYRKKLRSLQTVQMKPVLVQVPDSLVHTDSVSMEELDRAARSVIDSTFIVDVPSQDRQAPLEDSVYVITKDKELRLLKYNTPDSLEYDPVNEKYVAQRPQYYVKHVRLNIEQDSYMWYLRDYLVLPDVRLARLQQNADRSREAQTKSVGKKEKKGLKGFFKDLFKKKEKQTDSVEVTPPPQEEFDFIDIDTATQSKAIVPGEETRRGFFAPAKQNTDATEPALSPARQKRRNAVKANDDAMRKEEEKTPTQQGF